MECALYYTYCTVAMEIVAMETLVICKTKIIIFLLQKQDLL